MKKYWHRLAAISVSIALSSSAKYRLRLCSQLAWFAYDWVAYPASIYSSVIVGKVIPNGTFSQVLGWSTFIK